jgi:hypothetical protein
VVPVTTSAKFTVITLELPPDNCFTPAGNSQLYALAVATGVAVSVKVLGVPIIVLTTVMARVGSTAMASVILIEVVARGATAVKVSNRVVEVVPGLINEALEVVEAPTPDTAFTPTRNNTVYVYKLV